MDPFPNVDLSILTPQQREVVEMHYAGRLSFGAIALILDSTYKAVQQCHRRALRALLREADEDWS